MGSETTRKRLMYTLIKNINCILCNTEYHRNEFSTLLVELTIDGHNVPDENGAFLIIK